MAESLRVLVVEDCAEDTVLLVHELQRAGWHPISERVDSPAAMKRALETCPWDLIISDYSMPRFGGRLALDLYLETGLDIPFICVSGTIGEHIPVEMLKAGAHDYVTKNNLPRLALAVSRELRAARERRIQRQTEATAAYLASLVESCTDAIIGVTMEGIVVSWNAGADRLFGYSATEMIGQPIARLIPNYRPDELSDIHEKFGSGEHVQQFETVRVRKDGSPVEVAITASPVKDGSKRVIGASIVARDIGHRKHEENERLELIKDLTAALAQSHLKEASLQIISQPEQGGSAGISQRPP